MFADIAELGRYHELLWRWTLRELSIRYKQSLLGILWALLQPVAFTAMFTIVFSYVVPIPTDGAPYPIFSYSAMLPWTFLSVAVSTGVNSLVGNMNLVTKIYFPREILPIASTAVAGVDLAIGSVVFLGMMIWYSVPLHPAVVLLPLLLILQTLLILGIVLMGAAIIVFYRDLRFVIPLGLQLWMYASPIIYPTSLIETLSVRLATLYRLNPMVGLLESYRDILVYARWPQQEALINVAISSILVFALGYRMFKYLEPRFADVI